MNSPAPVSLGVKKLTRVFRLSASQFSFLLFDIDAVTFSEPTPGPYSSYLAY